MNCSRGTLCLLALLTFARTAVCNLFGWISVVTFPAVMTVPACGEVSALETHPAGLAAGQFVQLHVETAPSGVLVTLAGCN